MKPTRAKKPALPKARAVKLWLAEWPANTPVATRWCAVIPTTAAQARKLCAFFRRSDAEKREVIVGALLDAGEANDYSKAGRILTAIFGANGRGR